MYIHIYTYIYIYRLRVARSGGLGRVTGSDPTDRPFWEKYWVAWYTKCRVA